jgi:hypothetical protein
MIPRQETAVSYMPALIGAVLCIVIARFAFLGFLFLLPFGVMAYGYGYKTAWFSVLLGILGNSVLILGMAFFSRRSFGEEFWGILHFGGIAAAFTWMAAPPEEGPRVLRMPTVYRFIAASLLGTLIMLPVIVAVRQDTVFHAIIQSQAEALSSLYVSNSGADVVRQSLLERYLTADAILETLVVVALRGGVMLSFMVFFFVNRQLAIVVARLFRRVRPQESLESPGTPASSGGPTAQGGLAAFRTPPGFIWALSSALLIILLGRKLGIAPPEIAAWNVLVVCAMLYLAQGGGIAVYFLTRLALPPFMRLLVNVLICILVFSPGINAVLLAGLILLGIAENWGPFRVPKTNGPSSTPGM